MIPGLPTKYVFMILILEAGLIASCFASYSVGIGVLGTISALIVGYLHLTRSTFKVISFVKGIDPKVYSQEIRWGIVIVPVLISCGLAVPITGIFPTNYSVDLWKLFFFFSVAAWLLLEGVFRIRF